MKKTLFVVMGSLVMSSVAFAQDYSCQLLKDSSGHGIYGGPGYTVEVNGDDVVLEVSRMMPRSSKEFRMEKVSQLVEGATYEAQGVTAAIITTPMGGELRTSVSITSEIGNESYSAPCNTQEEQTPAPAVQKNYKIVCEDGNIFEEPLSITIRGSLATAKGLFSGPGDAMFSVTYKKLYVLELQASESGDGLQSVTITQPHVVRTPNGFQLSLKASDNGHMSGHLSMISTDQDRMPYDGDVSCTVKGF